MSFAPSAAPAPPAPAAPPPPAPPAAAAPPPTISATSATLSQRGQRALAPALPYWALFEEGMARGLHCARERPDGFVLLAVAENRLAFAAHAIARLDAPDVRGALSGDTGAYTFMTGRLPLREAWAAFAQRTVLRRGAAATGARVEAQHLVVGSGCGGLISTLTFLLCEPGDGVLLPTPTYAALYNDFSVLSQAQVLDVPTSAADGFALTDEALDEALLRAARTGTIVRMLFLINPHNPLGIVYREEDVRRCIRWARDNGVHCVVDEIYANSVWGDETLLPAAEGALVAAGAGAGTGASAGAAAGAAAAAADAASAHFVSAVDICANEEGTDAIVHVLWGASKDLGMSGFRTGVLHTRNTALLSAFANVNYFTTVSNHTQDALTQLLRDEAWVDEYMRTSRRLLRESYEALAAILRAAEIPFVEARAGMFVWIDLRRLLRGTGFEAERALTRELFDSVSSRARPRAASAAARSPRKRVPLCAIAQIHVLFTPGEYQHAPEPGFYRVCYGYAPKESVVVAFERLRDFAARRAGSESAAR